MKLNETYNRVSIVIVCNLYFVVTYVALWCSVETDKSDIRSPRSPEGTRGNLMPAPVFLFTNQLLFPLPYLSLPTSFFFPLQHFACRRISFLPTTFCFPPLPHLVQIPEGRIHTMSAKRVDENDFFLTLLHSSPFSSPPHHVLFGRHLRETSGIDTMPSTKRGGQREFHRMCAVASTHNT